MFIEINDKSSLERDLIFKLSRLDFDLLKKKKVKELSNSLILKGFRKGFVPENIILSRFDDQIKNEVLNDLLYKKLIEYLKSNKINYIKFPDLVKSDINSSEEFLIFYFNFEIYPHIELNFSNLNLKKYVSFIDDFDIDEEIDRLKNVHGSWVKVNSVELNDKVSFKILNKDNLDVIFFKENISVNKDYIEIINFLDFILNKKINVDYKSNFFDFFLSDFKGVEFNSYFKILNIERFYPSDLNDSFYSKFNFNPKLLDFRSFIRSNLNSFLLNIINKVFKKDLIELLLKSFSFDIPKTLLNDKILYFKNNNLDYSLDTLMNDVKLDLIFSEIIKKFNINVSKDEVFNFFSKSKSESGLDLNELSYSYIEKELYFEKIVSVLISRVSIIEEKIIYKDLLVLGKVL